MSILAPSAANLWFLIESYGINPRPIFLDEGLEVRLPIEPGTRVSYAQVDRIRARAAELSGDPGFGLRAGNFLHPSQLGALGYAWLASSSLHTALLRLHRYVRVLNDEGSVDVDTIGDTLRVRVQVRQSTVNDVARDNGQMSVLMALCKLNCGAGFRPTSVGFKHSAPEDQQPYIDLFNCPVEFSAQHNEMNIPLSEASRTLPGANSVLAQMNEQVVNRRLAQLDANDIPNRVRASIMEHLTSGTITDESVAADLHMTSRTMHRRLKQEGHSFRTLLKDVRRDLAAQYISDDSLTLTEITFLLGFSEMSSFSRAYKSWNGISPSEARKPDS